MSAEADTSKQQQVEGEAKAPEPQQEQQGDNSDATPKPPVDAEGSAAVQQQGADEASSKQAAEGEEAKQQEEGPSSVSSPDQAKQQGDAAAGEATTEQQASSEPTEEEEKKKEGESTKNAEENKQGEPSAEEKPNGNTSTPGTPRSAFKRQNEKKASSNVRFSQEVSVAAQVFDEKAESAGVEDQERRDQESRLKVGKEQQFFFSPSRSREEEKSSSKKKRSATKKSEEGEEKKEEQEEGSDEKKEGEGGGDSSPTAGESAPAGGDEVAAAADGEAAESPSQSKRSLKERLADFKYETDPNERLYWQGLVKIDHVHTSLQEKEQQEIAEAERIRSTRHEPSKAAQNLPTPSNFDEFLSNRDIRTRAKAKVWEKKKQKTLKDRMEDVTFSPSLGDKSKKLVNKMQQEKRYKDPVRGWRTHFNDFVTKEARVAQKFDNSDQAVTPVRVRTTQERFERLYQESAIRQAAQEIVNQAHDAEFSGGATFKPETSTSRGFSSAYDDEYGDECDTNSFSSRSHTAVIDSLLEKGENAKKKIEELRRRAEEETYTFTPKTNKVSQKMVQSWSEKAITPREERAARARTSAARSAHDLSADVKGVVDNKPKAKFDVDLFYSKIHRAASEREARLREIDERKREAEIAECTFRPRTTVSGSIQGSEAGSYSNYSTPRHPSARQQAPASSRQQLASARSNPRTSRTNLPASSSRGEGGRKPSQRQANERDYVVDLVAVPPSSSSNPPTSRTLLDEDGTTDLAALQNELMGVIAEWQNIDA